MYKTFISSFEDAVLKYPRAVAIHDGNQQISYDTLNRLANKIANHFRFLNIREEGYVAVHMHLSIEMVAVLLAILKAGATYVPIDILYPLRRTKYMIRELSIPLVICSDSVKEKLTGISSIVMPISQLMADSSSNTTNNLTSHFSQDHMIYIMFTSGSSGIPKPVGVTQIGISNLLQFQQEHLVDNTTRSLAFSSIGFDASIFELLAVLCSGGNIVVHNRLENLNLDQVIETYYVTHVTLPPSIMRMISLPTIERYLHKAIVAGEMMDKEFIEIYKKARGKVLNAYGLTETTVCNTFNPKTLSNNIGHPINNSEIFILNKRLKNLPHGVVGEIYIGNKSLSRGYVNSPTLTAEKFIANPFADMDSSGSRLYKTGDLGRYLPDGSVEFVGRNDEQVKINGCRVELGEIEAVIKLSEAVEKVVVQKILNSVEQANLIAYVQIKEGFRVEDDRVLNTIKTTLLEKLPTYMVPSEIILLDNFPLTINGKIDKKALTQTRSATYDSNDFLPQNAIEQILKIIWEEVLENKKISRDMNFFEIGGNSLLAIQMVSELQNAGCNLSLDKVFSYPTISVLAPHVKFVNSTQKNLMTINDKGTKNTLFLIHPSSGVCVSYLKLKNHIKNHYIYGINDPYVGNYESYFSSIDEMAQYYATIIKTKNQKGPYRLGGWSLGGIIALSVVEQLIKAGEIVETMILIDSIEPHYMRDNNLLYSQDDSIDELTKRNVELINTYKKPFFYAEQCHLIRSTVYCTNHEKQMLEKEKYNAWDTTIRSLKVYNVDASHDDLFDNKVVQNTAQIIDKILDK